MKAINNPENIKNRRQYFIKNNMDPDRVVGKTLEHTNNVLILNEPTVPKGDYDG
jgi:hypothetical protein